MGENEESVKKESVVEKVVENEDNSCASNPCGENASCWNGEGDNFLCTCDSDFPKGNPYHKCVKCVYDSHCPDGQACKDDQCVGRKEDIPQDFVLVGDNYYLISEDALAWPQAQYNCMNKQGHLVELINNEKITELQEYLMTRYANRSFWVGASDLENEGTFRWFYSGDQFNQDLWANEEPDNKNDKEHCVHLNTDFLKFSNALLGVNDPLLNNFNDKISDVEENMHEEVISLDLPVITNEIIEESTEPTSMESDNAEN